MKEQSQVAIDTVLHRRTTVVGGAGLAVFVAFSVYTAQFAPAPKLLVITWFAFVAMVGGALFGARYSANNPWEMVWSYGLASGAMITASAVFLVPVAIGSSSTYGGFGIAAGILSGFAAHAIGHRLSHLRLPLDRTTAQLTAHSASVGLIIGLIYATLPKLGPLLGLSIVAHKGPAGFAAARRFAAERPLSTILLPASGVGLTALPISLFRPPTSPMIQALLFGFGTGIFLHLAMDFLPSCEIGGEVHAEVVGSTRAEHELLDRLRLHAVASTVVGGVAIFLAWLVV